MSMENMPIEVVTGSVSDLYGEFVGSQYTRLLNHIIQDKNFQNMPASLQLQWASSMVGMLLYSHVANGKLSKEKVQRTAEYVKDEILRSFIFLMDGKDEEETVQ